jgi:catechol 2,3-dioxygenase-like lactoylglutathione lyase family enzyme
VSLFTQAQLTHTIVDVLTMKADAILRVARPTDNLARISEMYAHGLGFSILTQFVNHDGFDGVVLGHPLASYHLEFTAERGQGVGSLPTKDHLLVFYIPDTNEWQARCGEMLSAGFRRVASHNPYWDLRGQTFEDPDGFNVVLQNTGWVV